MRGWLATGAGAVLLAAALAMEAPATLVDSRVAALTAGRVRVAAATGTVWHGSGQLTLLPGGTSMPISWRIQPLPLLRGELAGLVDAGGTGRSASFNVAREEFSLQNISMTLPAAAVLRAAGVPAALAAAGGTLALDVGSLSRRSDRLDARMALRWRDASLAGPGSGLRIALGDVRLEAAGSGAQVPATLANSGGEVDIAGDVVFSSGRTPRVDARVKPRAGIGAERSAAIEAMLAAVGRSDGAGTYRIVWPLLGS